MLCEICNSFVSGSILSHIESNCNATEVEKLRYINRINTDNDIKNQKEKKELIKEKKITEKQHKITEKEKNKLKKQNELLQRKLNKEIADKNKLTINLNINFYSRHEFIKIKLPELN
eukprot:Pgem_evm1s18398